MASVVLRKPDIALLSDIAGTRLVIDHLIGFEPTETYDSALVYFDEGDDEPSLPVEYRGLGRTATSTCTARFVGKQAEHTACVAFVGLLRQARSAADARLVLRTNGGLVDGFDEVYVGKVSTWSKPRVIGQVWDVTFPFDQVRHTLEV